jgi:hypothetical protein
MPYSVFDGTSLYIQGKESLDGNTIHIAAHEHPISGSDQRVLLMVFEWATKSIKFPGDASTFITDIRTSPNLNPFTYGNAFTIYTPTTGRRTRLYDVQEVVAGSVAIVLADFTTSWTGTYKHVFADVNTATTTVTDLGSCGYPVEGPAGGNAYFAGVSIHGADKVVKTTWNPTDHVAGIGTGLLEVGTLTSGVWSWETKVTTTNSKVMRPINIPYVSRNNTRQKMQIGKWIACVQGSYTTFREWNTDVHFLEIL